MVEPELGLWPRLWLKVAQIYMEELILETSFVLFFNSRAHALNHFIILIIWRIIQPNYPVDEVWKMGGAGNI